MSPIRVLIADDEQLMRAALRIFLEIAEGVELVAEAVDGGQAVALAAEHRPDVILMDLSMPVMSGIEATGAIVQRGEGDVRVLVLTTLATDRAIVDALRAGASGYLVKDTTPEALVDAIREVHAGDFALSPQISRTLVDEIRNDVDGEVRDAESIPALTARELSIVRLLAVGMSNAEIATSLHLAPSTVKAHFGRITAKWDVRDRVQVLVQALRHGIVGLSDDEDTFVGARSGRS